MRTVVRVLVVLAIVYVLLLAGLFAAMYQPPAVFGLLGSRRERRQQFGDPG